MKKIAACTTLATVAIAGTLIAGAAYGDGQNYGKNMARLGRSQNSRLCADPRLIQRWRPTCSPRISTLHSPERTESRYRPHDHA